MVILVSDGHSNSRPGETVGAADSLKSSDPLLSLYAVAVGTNPNMAALALVATAPRAPYLLRVRAHLPDDVTAVARQLLDSVCSLEENR